MPEAVIKDAANMNLLGLLLKSILDQNLNRPWRYERVRKLDRAIGIQAGKMKVTIVFRFGEVAIERGWTGSPEALVEGTMGAFLGIALRRAFLVPWLTRKLRIRGRLAAVWPLVLLAQAHPEKGPRKPREQRAGA